MPKSGLRWLWVTIIVVILDRLTKSLAQKYLIAYTALPVWSFFNLTLVYNKGAAFSFLSSASGWQAWLFGGIAIAVTVFILQWLYRLSYQERWVSIALTCIAGGALGNLSDRILYGHVIDFIQLHVGELYWPAFNLADSAICLGVVMLGVRMVKKEGFK